MLLKYIMQNKKIINLLIKYENKIQKISVDINDRMENFKNMM